ncbi:hypothetical protein WA158_007884 [Blastocystis sp. Blastoise]
MEDPTSRLTLLSMGFSSEEIDKAMLVCVSVEEAICYLVDSSPKKYNSPKKQLDKETRQSLINLVDQDSDDESDEKSTDDDIEEYTTKLINQHNEKKENKTKDNKIKEQPINFNGETIYLNYISGMGNDDTGCVNFTKLFNINYNRDYDPTLKSIIMTSFVSEPSFLLPLLQRDIDITLITHLDKNQEERSNTILNNGKFITIYPPIIMSKGGIFHAKLLLIRFEDRLRVVISSANLTKPDWMQWSQNIWTQDFFTSTSNTIQSKQTKLGKEFETDLRGMLRTLKVPTNRIKDTFNSILFNHVSVKLVFSLPGVHSGNDLYKYGHMRLRNILKDIDMKLHTIGKHQFIPDFDNKNASLSSGSLKKYQDICVPICSHCSSLGTLQLKWGQEMISSCNGGIPYLGPLESHLHVVYPTYECVQNSSIGTEMAGSLTLRTDALFQSISSRPRALSHSKLLSYIPLRESPRLPWVYAGSHNFTQSAWGKLQSNGTKICIMNYELGIVLLPPNYIQLYNETDGNTMSPSTCQSRDNEQPDKDISTGLVIHDYINVDNLCNAVHLPFQCPFYPYEPSDEPFMQE